MATTAQTPIAEISPLDALIAHYKASSKSVQRAFMKYIINSVDIEKETRLEEKIQNGIADIKAGKGVSRKEGETVSQFFERLCTE